MAADSSGRSSMGLPATSFLVKLGVLCVVLYAVGFLAPRFMDPDSAFTGITVGISWSLATLIILVTVVVTAGTMIREALR